MPTVPASENEMFAWLLIMHLQGLTERLRQLPADKWDWTPDPAAPTARTLAAHAWHWLQCDRQHIMESDPAKHARLPDPPADPAAMCDALAEETERWRELIRSLTPEKLAEPRSQFDSPPVLNVRWFVLHITQNTIYKHGQFSTLFFALGLDGREPYSAPFPNKIYDQCFGPATGAA